jgi:hypothetical protein
MFRDYNQLQFTHFVVTSDGTIFGSAKYEGHIYNFLLHGDYVRAQHGEQWIDLDAPHAEIVRDRAQSAYSVAPRYKAGRFIFD